MKHVKWIFVVLLICSLTAFVEKDKPTGGLSEGDVAPDFKIESTSNGQPAFKLGNLKGKYISVLDHGRIVDSVHNGRIFYVMIMDLKSLQMHYGDCLELVEK